MLNKHDVKLQHKRLKHFVTNGAVWMLIVTGGLWLTLALIIGQ